MRDLGRQGITVKQQASEKEAIFFWRKNIGILDETRWDLFEEAVRTYMEENIEEPRIYFKQLNLIDFFVFLRAKFSQYVEFKPSIDKGIKEMIYSPLYKDNIDFFGPTINLSMLTEFTKL